MSLKVFAMCCSSCEDSADAPDENDMNVTRSHLHYIGHAILTVRASSQTAYRAILSFQPRVRFLVQLSAIAPAGDNLSVCATKHVRPRQSQSKPSENQRERKQDTISRRNANSSLHSGRYADCKNRIRDPNSNSPLLSLPLELRAMTQRVVLGGEIVHAEALRDTARRQFVLVCSNLGKVQ